MLKTPLSTKFYSPSPRASLVPRPRLVEMLQAGLHHPLTLISASAGSGKTTLFSQWRLGPGSKIPVAWLSLDPGDNDLDRFLQYLSISCNSLLPDFANVIDPVLKLSQDPDWEKALTILIDRLGRQADDVPLETLQKGYAQDIWPLLKSSGQTDWEAVLIKLINTLNTLETEVFLALDDYHLIENPAVHTAMLYLLEHLPAHLHLVIFTRADPPFPLALWRARHQLVEIRGEDLRFTLDESTQFLNQVMGLDLTSEQVTALERRTEGWITGLQLAALSMQGRKDLPGFVSAFTGSNHHIVDYLVNEVLTHQSDEHREFLLKTSILERLSGSLCDALTGKRNGSKVLEELDRANLFIIPLDDERHWYRYHHLFADLLQQKLEQSFPGLSNELHKSACCWFEEQDMYPEALQHALSSGDMQLVSQIISANVLLLMENNEVMPTLQKIDSLPLEKITTSPWLGIARAWILGFRQDKNLQAILNVIEQSIEKTVEVGERTRMRGHISAAKAYISGAQGDTESAIAFAKLAAELLPEQDVAVRAMTLIIWGDVLTDKENDPGAVKILEQALELALLAKKPHVAVIAKSAQANACLHMGELHLAENACLEGLEIADIYEKRTQQPLSATAEIYSMLSRIYAEWGEYDKAIQIGQKGLLLSEHWGLENIESICLSYLGRVLIFANQWEQANNLIKQADAKAKKISSWFWQNSLIYSLDSMLDCVEPNHNLIEKQIALLEKSKAKYPVILTCRLLLRDGHPDQALQLSEKALKELEGHPSIDTARLFGLKSLALKAMGDEKQALVALNQALQLAEPENRIATFLREGPAMERLLKIALVRSPSSEFVRKLLVAFKNRRARNPNSALPSGGLLEPLSRRELDVLRLLAQGSTDKQIAETLVIARETVHKHLKNIYGKLDVHNRTEAIVRARELGLL